MSGFGIRFVSSPDKYPIATPAHIKNIVLEGTICNDLNVEAMTSAFVGGVLRTSTLTDRSVRLTTASADPFVVGVADSDSIGDTVCMVIGGEFQVMVTGPVARGDFLASSATMGMAESTGTGGAPGDFAIASQDFGGILPLTGLIWARFKKAEIY